MEQPSTTQPDPTRAQIAGVHKVLYAPVRLRQINGDLRSIGVLMNLNSGAVLGPGDIRGPAGSGPNWYVQETGDLDPAVIEAASRCLQVAALYRQMAGDLDHVDIPDRDRGYLQTALTESAASLTLQGQWWRNPKAPTNPSALAKQIMEHTKASARAAATVAIYYKSQDEVLNIS